MSKRAHASGADREAISQKIERPSPKRLLATNPSFSSYHLSVSGYENNIHNYNNTSPLYRVDKLSFSTKGQVANSLGSVSHMVSVTVTQFYPCGTKAALGEMQMNRHRCVSS